VPELTTQSYDNPNRVYSVPLSAKDPKALTFLPVSVLRSFSELNTNGLLLRRSTKDLWTSIMEGVKQSVLLEGPKGIGKSSTLLQLTCSALASETPKFLVIYAPSMARWTAGYYPYYQSRESKSVFDQPELAQEILTTFHFMNKNLPEDIVAILENGKADPIAGLSQLMMHMVDQSSHRVLLVLDQVNALYCTTQYRNQQSSPLTSENFSVLSLFKTAIQDEKFAVVAATCNVDPMLISPNYDASAERLFDNKYELEPFTKEEVSALLAHFRELGHSHRTGSKFDQLIRFVSGGIPANISKACSYETIYTT